MELVTSLSGVSAPLIRSITLNFQSAYGHISTASPILPREFCNGGTPLLRYLDLKHCRIPWTSPLFDNLTSFSMNTGSFGSYDYAQGSLADFFDALERMSKGLEELDLCIDLPETTSFNGHSTIAFPKLTKLKLKTRLQDCITILNHLLLPISTSLELAVPGPPSENVPAAKAAGSELAAGIDTAWLATPLITTSSLAPNPKLSIHVLEISATQIAGGTKARFWIHGLDIARRPIRLTKGKRRTLTPLPPAPLTLTTSPSSLILIAALPIQNLQSIDIRAPINKWMWDELAGLPSLQSIALNGETGPSFLNSVCKDPAMTSRPPQPVAKATSTKQYQSKVEKTPKSKIRRSRSAYLFGKLILKKAAEANIISAGSSARPLTKPSYFPNLTHLSFTEVDFGLDQYLDPDDGMAINWDKFIDFLLFRRDSPKPINSIRALMCVNLMRPDVASIKAAVPRVEWDGLEEQRYAYDFRGIWSNGHDSEECEGQCHYHRGRHLNHGPSFGVPHTPLATGFGFNF
ncbi:hypothetical protein BJ165DRAFT_1524696 [Panaeolus papilionaceus]|nr:hypothetical protein BJ165DRAFT_1524696 [Panaeolus papilionaceus]